MPAMPTKNCDFSPKKPEPSEPFTASEVDLEATALVILILIKHAREAILRVVVEVPLKNIE